VKIKFVFLYIVIMLCFAALSCRPGDGSTLNPLGDPLGPPLLVLNPSEIETLLEESKRVEIPIKIKNLGGFLLEIKDIRSAVNWIVLQNVTFPITIIGELSLSEGQYQGSLKIISNDEDKENSEFLLIVKLSVTKSLLFEPTLNKIQSKIFSFNCTECHNSSNPPEGLNLTSGNSFGNLVNKKSNQVPALFLVEPFNPDDSYLIRKLEGGPNIVEERMPLDQAPLTQETINVVRAWIAQGAQNN
jgi:hypothetical protein